MFEEALTNSLGSDAVTIVPLTPTVHPKAAHSWNSSLLRETLAQGCLGEQCTHLRGPKKMLGAELEMGRGEPVELVLTQTRKAVQWHTWPFSS